MVDAGTVRSLEAGEERPAPVTLDISYGAIAKVVLTIGGILLIVRIWGVLILIILSLMLVATFNPMVRRLEKRLGRSWAITAVVSGVILLFVGSLALLLPPLVGQCVTLVQNAPEYADALQKTLGDYGIRIDLSQQARTLSTKVTGALPQFFGLLSGVLSGLTGLATVIILTVYLLIEGPDVGTSLLRLLPREKRLGARQLVSEIGGQVGGYMRGQLITSAIAGAVSFVILLALGIPNALALGVLAAITDAIPIVGFLLALLPAALIALTVSPVKALIVAVAYLVYNQIEGNVIAPKVYGNALGLSLTVIVISLLIGVELMGMLGALLALPVAAAIPSIAAYIRKWQEENVEPTPLP
jgi:predicted PurR-regulated permease PerM